MTVGIQTQPGAVLAERFRIRRRLGHGGTATVFLAEDCVLCRDVAIKRLHAEGSEADIRRFRREARLGASLNHPNLVTVFDTLSGADGVFIVMEYVRGRSLADLIGDKGIDARRLLEILRPVASALDYAHEHGVVHRDVKPANILIGEDRRVKLVDLGTATAGHLTQITAENEVMGTLAYIAPERLSGDSVGEPAADVYSLAVVAFEALTGRPPYRATTPQELLDKVLHGARPDVVGAWPDAPAGVADVLAQGMDPDPERRQHSAGALIRDLEASLSAETERAQPRIFAPTEPMTPPRVSEPAARAPAVRPFEFEPIQRRRRPAWLLPALALICLLIAGGVWLAVGRGGGESGGSSGSGGHGADQKQAAAGSTASSANERSTPTTTTPPAAPAEASAVSSGGSTTGAQLNEEGYSLINQGRYEEAIPVLRRAVASFPSGTTDINYAYALFNLGHALRLAGQPEAAIPILEQRLQIPNQTATVRRELAAARAEAGG